MNTLFVCLLASVLVVYGCEDNLQESKQQDTNCVNYCSNIIYPVLNVTKTLQNQVNDFNHQNKCLSQFENTNKLMEEKFASQDKKIEQKLRDLNTTSEQIMHQIKLQGKQVEQQLEHLQKAEEVKKQIPGPPYQQIGSKYYYIEESEEVNWFGAVNKCLIIGGNLVSFENQDEFNAIKGKLQAGKDYWIDLNDLAEKKKFISVATGKKPTYSNFKSPEPNNNGGDEHCVELYSELGHLMNDTPCSMKQLFICKFRN